MPGDLQKPPVFLHIGLPKTGTTYLQGLLAANRKLLERSGLRYPLRHPESMFHAAVDLRGTHESWGIDSVATRHAWDRLVSDVLDETAPALVSHENLSAADAEQVARVRESFPGRELHVVVTVRDLGRQLTAGWQEGVKSGSGASFDDFSRRLHEEVRSGARTHRFWKMQDVPAVLGRWASVAPPDRTHLVVCPQPGTDRRELWRRFGDAVGLPPTLSIDDPEVRSNESLGIAAIALLRDVNLDLRDRMDRATYRHVVKRLLAQRVLPHAVSPRPAVGGGPLLDDLRGLATEWVEHVSEGGFRVHGDLAELVPLPGDWGQPPDEVSDTEKYAAARLALVELLLEVGRLRRTSGRVRAGARLTGLWRAVRRR